jgi:exodeoxyribonuclease-3
VLKKGSFQEFIATHQPDILCLQETKAKQDQVEFDLPDYHQHWYSADKAGYSGTAIFSKVAPLRVIDGFDKDVLTAYDLKDTYGDTSREGRVLSAEFDAFWVVTVYTPNTKRDLTRLPLRYEQWDPAFLEHVRRLESSKPVFFCGDLNVAHTEIDLANPKENVGKHGFTNEEREGADKIIAAGFTDTFRIFNKEGGNYTWWTHWANARARNVGWRIDYFFAGKSAVPMVQSAAIHPTVMGSDHCPVSITIAPQYK